MASNTENLGLYMVDPTADADDYFDIDKLLNDNWKKVDEKAALAPILATAPPTEETVGVVGQFYLDTENGILYQCVSDGEGVYKWLARHNKWRLLAAYTTAGAYTFTPSDFPGITEIGAFIVGAGAGGSAGRAVSGGNGYAALGGASGRTKVIIHSAPFETSYNIVVGKGGNGRQSAYNGTNITVAPQNGGSSSFGGKIALGGMWGPSDTWAKGGQISKMTGDLVAVAFGEIRVFNLVYGDIFYPNECINPFDGKKLLVSGGAVSVFWNSSSGAAELTAQTTVTDDYGNHGSAGKVSTSPYVTGVKGNSYGCGGGAVGTATSSSFDHHSLTGAAGCDGAVLIYGR